jgi:radical SAM protein with 4Fe4S-binding SPASM domain
MKPILPYIIFETNSVCNLDCLYCYNSWKRPGQSITKSNSYKSAFRTLKKIFSSANLQSITFTGGEPLLTERISELVLYCKLKKTAVTIITNGCSGNFELYSELANLGVGQFILPLHSYQPHIHDQMTRNPGSQAKVINSINQIQSLNISLVIDIVLTKINIDHIYQTIQYINSLGIKNIMLTRYNIGGEGIKNEKLLIPDLESLRHGFSQANIASKELDMKISSNVCTPLCILNPDDYDSIPTFSCSSDINNMPITFDLNGNIRICNHSPRIIGNLFERNLSDIFNDEYVKSWKTIKPTYCFDCHLYDKCFGGCRAASEQIGSGLNSPDPLIDYYSNH